MYSVEIEIPGDFNWDCTAEAIGTVLSESLSQDEIKLLINELSTQVKQAE